MRSICLLIGLLFVLKIAYGQDTILLPKTGNGGFYNTCYGVIMDSGIDSNYVNYTDGRVSIFTWWTQSVSLYFEEFDTEPFFDSLTIYDGPGITSVRIGTYSGSSLQGQTIYSSGSSITLQFRSDDLQTGRGFKAWVSCLAGTEDLIQQDVNVYPNPATDRIYLDKADAVKRLLVYDVRGCAYTLEIIENRVDISSLPVGIYSVWIELKDGAGIIKRIVKVG